MTDKQDTFTGKSDQKTSNNKKTRGTPSDVDKHVGKRLKIRRNLMGLSQDELAQEIGVTFQQVQKYEHGTNRISSGRLYEFADILNVPINFFFEGIPGSASELGMVSDNEQDAFQQKNMLEDKETIDLVRAYYAIKDENIRNRLLQFIRSLADAPSNSDGIPF